MTATEITTEKKETNRDRIIRTYNDLKVSDNLEHIITHVLAKLRIGMHMSGYHYLKRAIAMVVEDPKKATMVTKGLYMDVAKEFNTRWTCVERSMRTAISSMKCSDEVKEEYIGFIDDSYTIMEFIASVTEIIRFNIT